MLIHIGLLISGLTFVVGALVESEHLTVTKQCLLLFIGLTELTIAYLIKNKITKKDNS